ncbi:hypothetical protein Bca52824_015880 [Brassica carinata]|uniref:Uncharacterized protein n=1 Tax=Brassica carinata TaxID=52824 RepID=A0A8X7W3Z5_BRACI|nr:hypothetical protein Bca52824_015880 [Brassica carinata]
MASLSFTQFLPFPRCNADVPCLQPQGFVKFRGEKWNGKHSFLMVAGRRKLSESAPLDEDDGGNGAVGGKKPTKVPKRSGARTTKKKVVAKDAPLEESSQLLVDRDDVSDNESDTKEEPRRTRKKASPAAASSDVDEGKTEKKVRRKRTAKKDNKEVEDVLVTSSTYDEASDVEEALGTHSRVWLLVIGDAALLLVNLRFLPHRRTRFAHPVGLLRRHQIVGGHGVGWEEDEVRFW